MLYKSTTMFIVSLLLQWIVYKYSLSNQPQGRWLPMKFNTLLIITLALTSTFSNAGLITDTNNNSFIDEATGIEWMDFGVNNQYTYNEVVSLLGEGLQFSGWRLPTEREALDLWYNAFQDFPSSFYTNYRRDGLYNDTYLHGGTLNSRYTYDGDPKPYFSPWDEEFDAMGFNSVWRAGTEQQQKISQGLFLNSEGNIATLKYTNITHANENDWVSSYGATGQQNMLKGRIDTSYSAMLMKVPEPSTLAIFALGVMGLVSRRLKTKKLQGILYEF
jgi:hypothetical protein